MIRNITHLPAKLTAAQLKSGEIESADCFDTRYPTDPSSMVGTVLLAAMAAVAPGGSVYSVTVVDYAHRERMQARTFTKLLDARQAFHEGIAMLTTRFGWVDPKTGEEHPAKVAAEVTS